MLSIYPPSGIPQRAPHSFNTANGPIEGLSAAFKNLHWWRGLGKQTRRQKTASTSQSSAGRSTKFPSTVASCSASTSASLHSHVSLTAPYCSTFHTTSASCDIPSSSTTHIPRLASFTLLEDTPSYQALKETLTMASFPSLSSVPLHPNDFLRRWDQKRFGNSHKTTSNHLREQGHAFHALPRLQIDSVPLRQGSEDNNRFSSAFHSPTSDREGRARVAQSTHDVKVPHSATSYIAPTSAILPTIRTSPPYQCPAAAMTDDSTHTTTMLDSNDDLQETLRQLELLARGLKSAAPTFSPRPSSVYDMFDLPPRCSAPTPSYSGDIDSTKSCRSSMASTSAGGYTRSLNGSRSPSFIFGCPEMSEGLDVPTIVVTGPSPEGRRRSDDMKIGSVADDEDADELQWMEDYGTWDKEVEQSHDDDTADGHESETEPESDADSLFIAVSDSSSVCTSPPTSPSNPDKHVRTSL